MKEKELPKGWVWKRLGDLIELKYGDGLKEENRDPTGKIPVYGSNGVVGYHNTSLTGGACLIVGRKGSIGAVHLSEIPCWPIDTTYYIEASSEFDLKFLFYLLKTLKLKSLDKSTSIPGLNRNDVYAKSIPLPPLPVQHQIAAILEQAKALKRQRQEAEALTGALLQSVFYEMFGDPARNEKGWPLENIKVFSASGKNAIKAGPFGSSLKKECYTKTGFKIYGQEQVIKDDLQFGDYYISQEKYQELINYSVQAGDILISLVGSYGKISIVPESFEPGIINPRLMKISLNQEKVLPVFFKHLFLTDGMLNQVEELSHGGTMDIINVGIVKQLKFPIPPLALQQQFAHIVEEMERIRERQVASGKEIEGLCEGLMQRAFAGELVTESCLN